MLAIRLDQKKLILVASSGKIDDVKPPLPSGRGGFTVYGSNNQGSVWLIDNEKGKAHFVSSFTGKFKPEQGVKIFKDGRYQDYMSLKGIQTILDIVNPGWSNDPSDLN